MQRSSSEASPTLDRRRALKLLGTAAAGAMISGCRPAPEGPKPTRVPLADLPPGGRLRVVHDGVPVELRRTAEGEVAGRSLLCTHTGCEVKWRGAENDYFCPCHEAIFSADGEVVAGPAPRPLRTVPATVEGETVLVGTGSSAAGSDTAA